MCFEEVKAVNKTDYKDMWVFIERDGDSVLPVSLELCSETRRLCDASGEKLVAVIVGSISDGELQRVLDCGVDKIIHVTGTGYDYFNNDAYTNLFTVLCRKYRPTAVMVGGMVPPLAIALAMLLFKGKFTPKERQSTITNFIMGLSFITEGAIPFAASDPVHVIPPCAIGAAVAGALSMLFNCTLPAPHGGIFVFGVITNWPMYIAALVAGVIVAAILLGIFRKKRPQD